MLAVIETHPVQYHAPLYRELDQNLGLPVTAIYASDFSVVGARDKEFNVPLAWDTDLLAGYSHRFLSRVADGGNSTADAVTIGDLNEHLKALKPKAILLTGYSPRFYLDAFKVARRVGCPLLFRAETTDHAVQRGPLKSWIRDLVLRRLYRSCKRLLYVGKKSRAHYERLGVSSDRLIFSPYCVDAQPFTPDENARIRWRADQRGALGIGEADYVVLFSGKLTHKKGVDLLLAAMMSLAAHSHRRTHLLFVGDGELRQELESVARQTTKLKVHFAGFQNQKQLSPFFHAADLFVLPSRYSETWGLVVNEALMHGIPAIVSDAVGSADDLVVNGETGFIFAVNDAAGLQEAIQKCATLEGPEVRTRCRSRVAPYSVRHAAEGIAKAYFETANDR